MNVFDRVQSLCKQQNTTIGRLEKEIGLSKGAAYGWKKHTPNGATLLRLSEYFGVDPLYITEGKEPEEHYLDSETAQMAENLRNRDELKVLFSAAKDANPTDIQFCIDFLNRVSGNED